MFDPNRALMERTLHGGSGTVVLALNATATAFTVHVDDPWGGFTLEPVDGAQALEYFHHPYVFDPRPVDTYRSHEAEEDYEGQAAGWLADNEGSVKA